MKLVLYFSMIAGVVAMQAPDKADYPPGVSWCIMECSFCEWLAYCRRISFVERYKSLCHYVMGGRSLYDILGWICSWLKKLPNFCFQSSARRRQERRLRQQESVCAIGKIGEVVKAQNVCISMGWLGITILVQIVNASQSRNNAIVNQMIWSTLYTLHSKWF